METPQEWRDSVARHLAAWVERQPKGKRTIRAIGPLLGVSAFTYGKLKNRTGPLGISVLVRLRTVLRVPLDELLGLPPIAKDTLSPGQLVQVRALIDEERKKPTEPPPPPPSEPPSPPRKKPREKRP